MSRILHAFEPLKNLLTGETQGLPLAGASRHLWGEFGSRLRGAIDGFRLLRFDRLALPPSGHDDIIKFR